MHLYIQGDLTMNRKYRKTVIAGNWKMNKTPSETKEFMTQLKEIGRAHV